jgi:hypothetical protein
MEWDSLHYEFASCPRFRPLARSPRRTMSNTQPRPMTAVHTNGFHEFGIQFCHCEGGASQAIQLSNHGYFPGTMVQPETVFSFGVLENFHAHMLSSKKSLYNYHDTLVKMTNAAFPRAVPVSVTESLFPSLLISSRVDIQNSVKLLVYGPTLQFGGGQASMVGWNSTSSTSSMKFEI